MKTCFYFFSSLFSIVLFTVCTFAQTADHPSGTGTAGDPYLIATLNNLYWLTQNSGEWVAGKVYKQTLDIDASTTSGWDSNTGFLPIGNLTTPFCGSYDGQSDTISGVFIDRSVAGGTQQIAVGLFGKTSGATIANVNLVSVNMTGNTDYGFADVGALIGYASNTTTSSCSASGSVSSPFKYSYVGGLIGYQEALSSITNCSSSCSVSGTGELSEVGGLLGAQNQGSTVSTSYSTGTVYTKPTFSAPVGGLIGTSRGTSYNGSYCSVSNCYSTSSVTGGYDKGGLIGCSASNTTASNCYSTGNIAGTPGGTGVGGLIGYDSFYGHGTATNCFWDTETSGKSTSDGGTGKSTAEMKTQSTFLNAGWSGSIWNMGDAMNGLYPYLKWQNPSGTPLPVELTFFTATTSNSTATLSWKTATEVNNYGFDVERRLAGAHSSTDAQSSRWTKVGFVSGNGTSNTQHEYFFTDEKLAAGKYAFRLKQIDNGGAFKYSQEAEVTIAAPRIFALSQNYPNPFNPSTTIEFTLAEDSRVSLKVFDMVGREVMTLVDQNLKAGEPQSAVFDASRLSSGLYFYRLDCGKSPLVKKLVLTK